jgi:hypothetical protein
MKGRRRRSSAAAVRIQSECALTLINAGSRRNLTGALIRTVRPKYAAARSTNYSGCIQFNRTNVTRKWGVSDPLRTGRGAKKGAAKWGSLTPHLPPTVVATYASAATGRQKAPPLPFVEVPYCQRPASSLGLVVAFGRVAASSVLSAQPRGTVLPSFGSPTLFPFSEQERRRQRRGDMATID